MGFKMNPRLEKRLACYLCRTMDMKEYSKLTEWLGRDRNSFNQWVKDKGTTNI